MNEQLQQRIAGLSTAQRQLLEQKLYSKIHQSSGNNRILPDRRSDNLSVSFSQQRLWFLSLLEPDSWIYNRPANIHLDGKLSISVLERCLNEIIHRHEVLRSNFISIDGQPTVVIRPELILNLEITDLSLHSIGDRHLQLQQLLQQSAQHQFDLGKDCLFTTGLVKLAVDEYILLLTFHHSIFDAWSINVLSNELTTLYDAYSEDKISSLPDLEIQYLDFASWQIQQFQHSDYQPKLDYWKQQLGGELPILALPIDRPRPAMQTFNGATHNYTLSLDLTQSLKQLSQNQNVTLFMTLLAAYQVLLYRYSGQTDIIVGTPTAGRERLETENLIGVFINTLALRTQLAADSTFENILAQVRRVALEAYTHQEIPFEKLVEELQLERNLSHPPLVQTLFQLRKPEKVWQTHQGLKLAEVKIDREVVAFDLCLDLTETNAGLVCQFEYNTDLFDRETIERMAGHFQTLLTGIVADPHQQISRLQLLTAPERRQLLTNWNDPVTEYPLGKSIHHLFEEQVARTPDAIAVVFKGQELTYRELNHRANQLAHYLKSLDVGADKFVGISVERSLEMVVGLLGILKAGGAYVPLDPAYPSERLAYMMADAEISILLTQSKWLVRLPEHQAHVVCLDSDWEQIARYDRENPDASNTGENLAYVIYTSGSTGQPKGVIISHHALSCFVQSAISAEQITAVDRVLQFASINFDVSVQEIYPCLLTGATLVLRTDEMLADLQTFFQACKELDISVLDLPTAYWHQLAIESIDSDVSIPSFLRLLKTGGEKILPAAVKYWLKYITKQGKSDRLHLINAYGPTETTVTATIYRISADIDALGSEISIGRPLSHVRAYILDRQQQLVPIGVSGELHIGGDCLAIGYLNRPELTSEKFIPDPFNRKAGARLYKTGDLARYLPDGNIEYLGRIDNQVKIRGFRIELGEIESVVSQHPEILNVVAIVREDIPGDKRLVAYVVVRAKSTLTQGELRQFLQQKLPDYLVPSALIILAQFPLTSNGKIDRRALPAPDRNRIGDPNFVAPRTEVECQLAQTWSKLLQLDLIGIHDNFFELGGHSLLATQVMSRIQTTYTINFPLRNLFEYPTIAQLCDRLSELSSDLAKHEPIVTIPRQPHYLLSFAQQRLWFLDRLEGESNATYNILMALRLAGNLNHAALLQAIQAILDRHQSLATSFSNNNGDPVQIISANLPLDLEIVDLTSSPAAEREDRVIDLCQQAVRQPFNLAVSPLFRIKLFKLTNTSHVLCLTIHHIITDGWSMGILQNELSSLYQDAIVGRASSLEPLPIRYIDFAQWQRNWLQGAVLDRQVNYWNERLANIPPLLNLPTDRSRPPIQTFVGKKYRFQLTTVLTHQLIKLSERSGVTLFMTLLAAFSILLSRYSQQTDIVIGSPIANRNRQEIEPVIGFFANTLPLRIDLGLNSSFEELLTKVREICLDAYSHQDLPFEKLVDELQPERSLSYHPIFQTMFSLQNTPTTAIDLTDLTITPVNIDTQTAKFDLTLALFETPDGLVGTWEYNTDLFFDATIERMVGHFQTLLAGIVAEPYQSIASLPLLTAAQQQQFWEWNQTQTAYPQAFIHQLFEERVATNPDAIAVVFEERQFTYRELNDRSNQLAHHLQSLGVQPEVLVGICVERSVEMVVGILGILKAGGAYLPLDPSTPTDRLAYILTDAQSNILVTDSSLLGNLPNCDRAICLDTDLPTIDRYPTTNLDPTGTADNLAYVIYTSGSTGNPKGVLITHTNVVRLFTATAHWYRFDCQDVWTLFHSFAFDFSVWEIWGALLHGGRLVVVPCAVSRDPDAFYQLLISERVTVLNQTPSAFDRLITSDARSPLSHKLKLRLAIFGGEALNLSSLKPWFDRHGDKFPQLVNMYGITETTVHVTYRPLTCEDVRARGSFIGRPIPDLQVYVLDPYLQPLPIGVIGEMYVGGAGVSRGYWQRDELTNTRFIPNPSSACPTARLYRTGDLARYLPDGQLEYIGRIDNQVKLRGFRIELGEIETVLIQHPAISRSTVIVREDNPGDKQLVAYWMSDRITPPQISQLRDFIAQKLPNYMMPSAFVLIDSLPLTPNGKIDRHALPIPDRDAFTGANASYSPPKTPLEQQLATIWSQLLKLERVGIHDNFFELGGHSLLAIKLVIEIATTLDLEISLQQLWQTPTIAELAASVVDRPIGSTAIPRRAADLPLPLSFAQQRLWFLERLDPDAGAYHIPVLAKLTGTLDLQALQQALDAIVAHHEVLRTNFSGTGDRLVQVIRPPRSVELLVLDFQVPAADLDRAIELRLQQEILRTFDLERDLMLRGCVVQISPQEQIFLATIHHIAADGWSMGIFATQLESLYQTYCDDRSPDLPALPIQYADFTLWQRQWLQGEVFDSHLAYWQQQLAGAPPILSLPIDRPRPAIQTFNGNSVSFTVDRELTRSLTQLSRQAGVTLFMTLLAAFDILLYRYTGSEDLLVGVPVANRERREIAGSIGCFVNTLVLRGDLSGNPSFCELLERIERMAVGAYSHQDLPFDVLVDRLQPQRDLSYSPIFQVLFGFEEDIESQQIQLANLITSPYTLPRQTAKFDLSLALEKQDDSLVGTFTYNTDLFEAETSERMVGHFQTLLAAIVVAPQQSISSLPLLTAAEQQQLSDWNQTQIEYPQACIHQLFEERVAKNPDAIAVVFEDLQLTYRQLNDRSNQLARHLQGLGVKPDVLVGIYVERSLEMLVGLLGILKAGGAYVPLDPSYPMARLNYMVTDAGVEVLLTQQQLLSSLPSIVTQVICLDADWGTIDRQDIANLPQQLTPAHLAYTIYTSGSTGNPKGVQICHRSVTNFLNAMQQKPGLTERDTLLSVTTISFDIAVLELYLPLIVGAKIVLASREIVRDGRGLLQLLTESQATVMQATPTTWQLLLAAGWTSKSPLKILCGGEALSSDLASQLVARGESVWNLYGPTETTVWATLDRVDDLAPAAVSIGRPIDNIQTYILDPYLQPVPIGVPGELYIGGDCLATGYLDRPDLTAQKFIANPFVTAPEAHLYKTGDLVKYLPNGKIEYLSRLDDLVKLRGVRIELGEIESLLATHPEIRSTVAIVREDTPGDKRLVVYIIPNRQQSPPQIRDLHDFLAQKLPRHSLPSAWVMLADFPMTPNGKIDRRALPAPDLTASLKIQTEQTAPKNSIESRLVEMWSRVLGLEAVGIHDNFFDLGGHSLLAVNMFSEIDRIWGVNLPLATLFQYQTIAELATIIAPTIADVVHKVWAMPNRAALQLPAWNSLLKIKQGGSIDSPMFFIHDVSGSVLFYREIADRIRSNRTFYILQPRGMDGRTPPVTSITEMAANYIEEILQVQPEGAYYLGGYSFGGFVAFEIARQLHELGKEVKLLAIIDTGAPRSKETAECESASPPDILRRNHSRLAKFLRLSSHERIDYIRNGLRIHRTFGKLRLPYQFYLRYIKRSLSEAGSLNVYWTNARAFNDYVAPSTYPGRVTLFYSDEKPQKLAVNPNLNWDKLATGGVELEALPGSNHATIIRVPHVNLLSEKLTFILDRL